MALILNLETATKTCSVALAKDGLVLASKEETSDHYSHAEQLNTFIKEVLENAELKLSDIDAVAISAGPGSYTGLRIGTSTAKGICYALDKKMISINSLKALAALSEEFEGLICPMFDARRMEVYAAVYDKNLSTLVATEAKVVDELSYQDLLEEQKMVFLGPGASKCQAVIDHPNTIFDLKTFVSASGMAQLADEKFGAQDFEDVAYFEPAYLKDFVAGKPKKLL